MSKSLCYCASTEHWCNTEIKLDKVNYVWTIHNFDFHEAGGTVLQSSIFSAVTNSQIRWYLKLKLDGETDAKDHVSFHLHLSRESVHKEVFAKYAVFILDRHQKEICWPKDSTIANSEVYKYIINSEPEDSGWGWNDFFKKDEDFRNNFLVDNKLTIKCEVHFSQVYDAISKNFHQCNSNASGYEYNVPENLECMVKNREFTDVVLSVNGKDYPAHKVILAAHSTVFAAMFKSNMREAEQDRVEIEDISEEVVGEMLKYIYTGKCENLNKLADKLLAAADKYDLDQLKSICSGELCKTMSVENSASVLILADMHGANELKNEAIKFIVAKPTEVMNTEGWKCGILSNPQLLNEIFLAHLRR